MPRPAMLVATVTRRGCPAQATISASLRSCRALRITGEALPCQQFPDMLRRVDRACAYQNGPALARQVAFADSTTAFHLSRGWLKICVPASVRRNVRLVGMRTTRNP